MGKKVHCRSGHVMNKVGDMWKCLKKLKNGKIHNESKSWNYVTKI